MVQIETSHLWVTLEERVASIATLLVLTTTDGRNSRKGRIPRPAGAPFPTRFDSYVDVLPTATYAYLDFVMSDGTVLLDSRVSIPIRRP